MLKYDEELVPPNREILTKTRDKATAFTYDKAMEWAEKYRQRAWTTARVEAL